VVGILYPLHSYNLNILKVKGRSDLFLKLEIFKKTPMILGLIWAVYNGIYALLYLQVVLNIIFFFINSSFSGRMINYSSLEQLKDILPSFLLVSVVGFLVFGMDNQLQIYGISNFMRIIIGFLVGGAFYLGLGYLVKSEPLLNFKKIILNK
jgi:teichuronic acid exporter